MASTDKSLTVSLWVTNLGHPVADIDAWAGEVDAQLASAARRGADLLVMPEWMSAQWLTFAPPLASAQEVPWMAEHGAAALAAVADLPARHGVGLLLGSMPVKSGEGEPGMVNRSHLLLPDGQRLVQDKLCLTPDERDPEGWWLAPGRSLPVVQWRGLRIAVLVCLDVELPALATRLAGLDLDLILVPSMTQRLSGYHRVFACARARAVELQTAVCAVGCIGAPRQGWKPFVSGAAAFLPCEQGLGQTGVHAELLPAVGAEGPGPVLTARDLPLIAIRERRRHGAEVWPGNWDASHVTFQQPG